MKKTLLIYSGGKDSTVLLYHLRALGHDVECVSFNYNQRHKRELESAKNICSMLDVKHSVLDIPQLHGSALTGNGEVPHGHYAEESMKQTVVPNRNMVMLSHAASMAIAKDKDILAYGCHAGDHAIYPDCRTEFVEAMKVALSLCDWKQLELFTPFVEFDKGWIARLGHELEVPFDMTWTCYEGGEEPCGKCGSCVERNEALATIVK
jgi:7-cyano-7-deazaguanine synthase